MANIGIRISQFIGLGMADTGNAYVYRPIRKSIFVALYTIKQVEKPYFNKNAVKFFKISKRNRAKSDKI